jgi:hypothetical protein
MHAGALVSAHLMGAISPIPSILHEKLAVESRQCWYQRHWPPSWPGSPKACRPSQARALPLARARVGVGGTVWCQNVSRATIVPVRGAEPAPFRVLTTPNPPVGKIIPRCVVVVIGEVGLVTDGAL